MNTLWFVQRRRQALYLQPWLKAFGPHLLSAKHAKCRQWVPESRPRHTPAHAASDATCSHLSPFNWPCLVPNPAPGAGNYYCLFESPFPQRRCPAAMEVRELHLGAPRDSLRSPICFPMYSFCVQIAAGLQGMARAVELSIREGHIRSG
jgi:hypothetical protein